MPGSLILYYFGRPQNIRNKVIDKDITTEDWYYYQLFDNSRIPLKDYNGENVYKSKLNMENDILDVIIKP